MTSQRSIAVYSGVLTPFFSITLLAGFTRDTRTKFAEIDVQRINVREPDGTLRMATSDSAHLPGVIVKSKEHPRSTGRRRGCFSTMTKVRKMAA